MEKHSALLREATKRVCKDEDVDFVANQIRHEIVALRNTYDGSIGEACHRWLYNQSKSQSKQKPPIEYDTICYHLNPNPACFQGHPYERCASLDAFKALTANEQTLLRLRCENGLSMPEIAERTHQTVAQATETGLKARDNFWKAFNRLFWTAYFANLGDKSPHLGEAYLHWQQRLHRIMPLNLTQYLEIAINQKRADTIKVKHQESKKLQEYVQSGESPAVVDAETNQEISTGRTASPSNAPYDDVASQEQKDVCFQAGVQLIKEWNRKPKKYLKIEVLLFLLRLANIVPEWHKVMIITDPDLLAIIEHWAEEAPLSKTDIADRYGVSLDRVNQIFREIRGVLQVKIKRMGYC